MSIFFFLFEVYLFIISTPVQGSNPWPQDEEWHARPTEPAGRPKDEHFCGWCAGMGWLGLGTFLRLFLCYPPTKLPLPRLQMRISRWLPRSCSGRIPSCSCHQARVPQGLSRTAWSAGLPGGQWALTALGALLGEAGMLRGHGSARCQGSAALGRKKFSVAQLTLPGLHSKGTLMQILRTRNIAYGAFQRTDFPIGRMW